MSEITLNKNNDVSQIEKAILAAKKEWEATFDLFPDIIILTDLDGKIIRCNRSTINTLNTTYQEIVGKPISSFYARKKEHRFQGSDLNIVETQIKNLSQWFELTSCNISNEEQKDLRLYLFRDITQQKIFENEILKQKQFFEALFQYNPIAVITLDTAGVIRTVNPAFTLLFGYSQEEAIGIKIDTLIVPEEPEKALELTQKVVGGGTIHSFAQRRRKDGSLVEVELAGVPVIVEGEKMGILAIYHDVSDLVEAKRIAEQADRAKSEFLANMSHEIRTPMNGVMGMIELLLDTPINPEQKDYLVTAHESAEALLGILNDILDFSKIEAGQLVIDEIDYDLRSTVEGVVYTLAARAESKGLEIACLIDKEIPNLILGDAGRLRQILINLVGNAIKFTSEGEVTIRVELEKRTESHLFFRFRVTDTGVGIPLDRQKAVFERFIQADSSSTRKFGGTGLGLTISSQLAQIMGGDIGVESEPGKGSTFWFTIRAKTTHGDTGSLTALPKDLVNLPVLVVDDNQTNRYVLEKMVSGFGCNVFLAPSGKDALSMLTTFANLNQPVRLVLLDLQMPEMDGEEVLQKIKTDPLLQKTTVIILTSLGQRGDASRLESLGCNGYLLKPVRQKELFATLLNVLGVSKQKFELTPKPLVITHHSLNAQQRALTHILLAEDNPINQKLAVRLLEKAGYPVDVVSNGLEAIEAVKKKTYRVVLMDVQMPEMDGLEATRRIRGLNLPAANIPIIAMTAHAMSGDEDRCIESGMNGYLSKPLNVEGLFNLIEKYSEGNEMEPRKLSQQELISELKSKSVNLFDLGKALPRFSEDLEVFFDLLEEFIKQLKTSVNDMENALVGKDAKIIHFMSHLIKGAAGNFEMNSISIPANELEQRTANGSIKECYPLILEIKNQIPLLEDFFLTNKGLINKQ
ncbi:MAG: response regulator [Chloroflexi bacterium]|nr:response regulator [Chloroflexota bacterium]